MQVARGGPRQVSEHPLRVEPCVSGLRALESTSTDLCLDDIASI
jgi:hypothetical protein